MGAGLAWLSRDAQFERLLGVSELEAHQLSDLLLVDGWLFRAFGNDDQGRQQFQIDPSAVLRVRNVRTPEDYFRAGDGITEQPVAWPTS